MPSARAGSVADAERDSIAHAFRLVDDEPLFRYQHPAQRSRGPRPSRPGAGPRAGARAHACSVVWPSPDWGELPGLLRRGPDCPGELRLPTACPRSRPRALRVQSLCSMRARLSVHHALAAWHRDPASPCRSRARKTSCSAPSAPSSSTTWKSTRARSSRASRATSLLSRAPGCPGKLRLPTACPRSRPHQPARERCACEGLCSMLARLSANRALAAWRRNPVSPCRSRVRKTSCSVPSAPSSSTTWESTRARSSRASRARSLLSRCLRPWT